MAIEIDNDYPEFRITDTLHQLVDRLNQLTNVIDSNMRLLDSSVNNMLLVVDSEGNGLVDDSALVINSTLSTMQIFADSAITFDAGTNLTLGADQDISLDAGGSLLFNTDSGEIILRAQGTQFGALKKATDGNELEVWTGNDLVIGFDSTLNATFAGAITLPGSGASTPNTTAKTVHGALNEIISEHDSDHDDHETRISALEPVVTLHTTQISNLDSRLDVAESDLSDFDALNIEARLLTIEDQIVQINNRLDILEIFT